MRDSATGGRGRIDPLLLTALTAACATAGPMGPGVEAGPRVETVAPAAQSRGASATTDLLIRFDRALSDATAQVRVSGRWSGPVSGTVSLAEEGRALRVALARPLAAGEQVTATLVRGSARSRDGRAGPGFTWNFWVGTRATSMTFASVGTIAVRRPQESRIQTYGAFAGDLDRDGWSDLVLPNEQSADLRIFLNDGTGGYGAFDVVPVPQGDDPSTNEGADLDGDGDLDFVVGSARGQFASVYHGDGAGGLVHRQNLEVGIGVRGVCLIDFENDGDPDLVATAFGGDHVAFFTNDGSGAFGPPATMDVADGEWSCAAGDADDDGLVDVFVGARTSQEVVVLGSSGDGRFREIGRAASGGDPWMLGAGDVDGDGRVDVAAVNAAAASLTILRGDGRGGLVVRETHALDGFPLAVDLGDLNGDGHLDVVTSDFSTGRFVLFRGGAGGLSRDPVELAAPAAASCAILHDRDNDGDLDVSGIDEVDDVLILFENR